MISLIFCVILYDEIKEDNFLMTYDYIKRNYECLCDELASVASRVGVKTPTLVSVTKSGSDEELMALVRAGALDIGENRPQELRRRLDLVTSSGLSVRAHEIGSLQTNKVRLIAPDVTLIHSLDRLSLAEKINAEATRLGRKIPVLLEINSACEEQKGGILPEDACAFYESVAELGAIEIRGLMTMGPVCDTGEEIRPYFRLTKKLFDKMKERYGFGDEPVLSMGMSDSYSVAIEEGSTLVRVGRRLFVK